MGPRSRNTAQEGDSFCLLEMNVLWCEKCKSIPAKDLVKMLEGTGTKVSIYTVKRVLYRHNLKGCSIRKKPLLQNRHKKPYYSLQLHMGTKILLFGEMSSGLMKQKCNCLAIMTIIFGGKRVRLASRTPPSQP
ncbi:hypothetical protein SKAU_G00210090 [Synaphobranchus kaupii]|uniref:Transposase Tc1-like domain-containing protein n=1 Tax=Synaphobranchus kaupii TaxID=118154 RepID=A0A9Q1F8X7_SYNKA|nr:hypothetical protein SKAU_G00210090 [Synaphobranchus kaupii]